METIDDSLMNKNGIDNFNYRGLIIWLIILLMGIIFFFNSVPGGIFFITFSSAGLSAYSFFYFIAMKSRNSINSLFSALGLIWVVYLISGLLNHDYTFLNEKGVGFYFAVTGIYYLGYYAFKKVRNDWKNPYRK